MSLRRKHLPTTLRFEILKRDGFKCRNRGKSSTPLDELQIAAGPQVIWRNRIVGQREVDPATLTRHPQNWRTHPERQAASLRAVLERVGMVQGVIVNRTTGHILDGHLRVDAAIGAGQALVPITEVELSEEEERLVLATFDPLGGMAGVDEEMLSELVGKLEVGEQIGDVIGALMERNGLESVGDQDEDREGDPGPGPTPTAAAVFVKPGDLWQLGSHRLLCGDARRPRDVSRLMEGVEASACWTDPPYGVSYVGKGARALEISGDDAAGLADLLRDAFAAVDSALGPGAAIYIAHPASGRSVTFVDAFVAIGWRLHQTLIWVKDAIVLGHSDYHYKHEPILFGYKPGPGRRGRGGEGWFGGNSEASVFEVPRPKRSDDHPTMKPVALIERMILNSTDAGAIVLDPFCGSGSTLIACERTGRCCRALEIDPVYAQVILERWARLTGLEFQRLPS